MVLDRFPDHSEKADICQTKIHAHCHKSLAATLASLQKVSHSPPNVIQREEMLRRRSHGQRPSQPGLETKDQMLQILETPLLGRQHSTVTALVRCMRFVLAAAAAKMIVGAESRNSLLCCSPIPKTSNPILSAYSICSINLVIRSDALTDRLKSPSADAKLSIPTCILYYQVNNYLSTVVIANLVGMKYYIGWAEIYLDILMFKT
jgi:hypothetical protein